ncbi:MAG: sulfatase-like hydrolase/transferase, partial [Verrucomicrobiota bacterium]
MRFVAFLPLLFLSSIALSEEAPPNVLFIAVDDLNDWVSAFEGHPQAKTPHLDAFAESGAVVFQNAHCAGPVCGPSRSALLSGFWPSTSGIYGNSQNMLDSLLVQEHATLPEYFAKHGYRSLSMGKIYHAHHSANGVDKGQWAFQEWHSTLSGSGVDLTKVTSRDKNL